MKGLHPFITLALGACVSKDPIFFFFIAILPTRFLNYLNLEIRII